MTFKLGETVEWESPCPRNQLKAHRGKVIEVVPANGKPSQDNYPWDASPRNHESYLIRETFVESTTLYWPRVKWLRRAK